MAATATKMAAAPRPTVSPLTPLHEAQIPNDAFPFSVSVEERFAAIVGNKKSWDCGDHGLVSVSSVVVRRVRLFERELCNMRAWVRRDHYEAVQRELLWRFEVIPVENLRTFEQLQKTAGAGDFRQTFDDLVAAIFSGRGPSYELLWTGGVVPLLTEVLDSGSHDLAAELAEALENAFEISIYARRTKSCDDLIYAIEALREAYGPPPSSVHVRHQKRRWIVAAVRSGSMEMVRWVVVRALYPADGTLESSGAIIEAEELKQSYTAEWLQLYSDTRHLTSGLLQQVATAAVGDPAVREAARRELEAADADRPLDFRCRLVLIDVADAPEEKAETVARFSRVAWWAFRTRSPVAATMYLKSLFARPSCLGAEVAHLVAKRLAATIDALVVPLCDRVAADAVVWDDGGLYRYEAWVAESLRPMLRRLNALPVQLR